MLDCSRDQHSRDKGGTIEIDLTEQNSDALKKSVFLIFNLNDALFAASSIKSIALWRGADRDPDRG